MPRYRTTDGRSWEAQDAEGLATQLRAAAFDDNDVFASAATNEEFRRQSSHRAIGRSGRHVRRDPAPEWLSDLITVGVIAPEPPPIAQSIRNFILGSQNPPDFERSVSVVLAIFAVFTGFTINGYLQDSIADIGNLNDWHWWGFFALVALLLRYIFGSAVHLNGTYVGKSILRNGNLERGAPKSRSVFLLFKDLMFLVLFGMIAIYIKQAAGSVKGFDVGSFDDFMKRSMWFVSAGFLWSVSDFLIRRFWARAVNRTLGPRQMFVHDLFVLSAWVLLGVFLAMKLLSGEGDVQSFLFDSGYAYWIILAGVFMAASDWLVGKLYHFDLPEAPPLFWRIWVSVDAVQLLSTLAILTAPWPELARAEAMAALYTGFLFLDFLFLIRAVQLNVK